MTRKKVELAYISSDSSRKATFKKRSKGLIKKVNELSTLCGVSACAIIYSPYDSNPKVWPSNSGVERVISEFRVLPEMDQQKKMVDQDFFIKQRIAKSSDQWKRVRKENREIEMTEIMFQSLIGKMNMFPINIIDLNDLGYLIDQFLKELNHKIEISESSGMQIGQSSNGVVGSLQRTGPIAVAATTGMEISESSNAPTGTIIEFGSSSSSAAAGAIVFNSFHQQNPFVHPMGPYANMNQNQNQQQWFMEMMNHPEQMGLPYMDDINYQHHPHQLSPIPSHSSTFGTTTVSPTVGANNIFPVTGANNTNNI